MATVYDNVKTIRVIQKEYLTLSLTIKDSQGNPVDLSSAELQLTVKENKDDTTYAITVANSSFNTDNAANGIITCPLTSTNLNIQGTYWALLKITFSSTNIKKGYFKIFVDSSEE